VTIFHVDVVEYFTRFYLHGLLRPETAARFHWFGLMPDVLRLVFEKQYQCVRYSARIVVPSAPMKEMILRCYPVVRAGEDRRVAVGRCLRPCHARGSLVPGYSIADDEVVIITLSRLSP
jgi:hypothetical protein